MIHYKRIKCAVFVGLCFFVTSHYAVDSFSLEQVRLLDGPFKHAQDLNRERLLQYDVDRLLASYRKEAGLEPKAESYPNWIGLDGNGHLRTVEIRGHDDFSFTVLQSGV